MNYSQTASFWIGAVVILIYALERFNSPPTNRPSTTWLRYYSAAFIYVGLFELTYVLLCYHPELLQLLKELPGLEQLSVKPGDNNTLHLSVSTLLSVLVPKILGLYRIDLEIRHQLQRVAAIPTEARRFAHEIQRSHYQPDGQLQIAVRSALRERGLEGAAEPEQLQPLRRLIAMMLRLHEWEADLRFTPFLHERDAQYAHLQSRYQRVMEIARGYALPPVARSGASAEPASQRFVQAFDEEILALLQEGSELISHSLLKCCLRAVTREQELTHMGLVCRSEPQLTIDVDQLTLLFAALIALLTLYVMLVFRPQLGADASANSRMFVLLAKIPLIYTLAMICAVLPKQHWPLFQRRDHAHIPAFGYLLTGLMAATAAVLVSLLIDILLLWQGTPPAGATSWGLAEASAKAWADYWARRFPFMLLPFTAAATMAFILDWQWLQRWGHGWPRRLADATAMALAMGLAGWLVHALVLQLNPAMTNKLWAVVMLVVMIGALLGALVPCWFRQHRSHGTEASPAALPEAGATIVALAIVNQPVGKTNR